MELDVLLIISLGIFLGFFIQTIIGFSGALVALPILLISIALPEAISYISIFYFLSSIYLVQKEWTNIDKKVIVKLALTSIIGLAAGISILNYGNLIFLKKVLGIFIILYVIYSYFSKGKIKKSSFLEYVLGIFGGFFSGLFSTGGPLFVIVVKNATKDIKTFRATMFGVLGLVSIIRVPLIAFSGILKLNHLYYALFIMPFFLLSIFLGKKMYSKLNEQLIKNCVLVALLFSGLMLTFKS
ncbi:sulfite exporter TauE/SafE family protein [Polaribacter sp. Asnod6-C07]|uniref:sulfite exporter TauE/SafE family protein n=1 Tax=Polaribacter sp. Asnod6-C07 TaxID=3160582 RepID=UPI003864B86A